MLVIYLGTFLGSRDVAYSRGLYSFTTQPLLFAQSW